MEWINVNDRLPNEDERVLIYTERDFKSDPKTLIGFWQNYKGNKNWYCWDVHEDEFLDPTHWMLLPKEPNT